MTNQLSKAVLDGFGIRAEDNRQRARKALADLASAADHLDNMLIEGRRPREEAIKRVKLLAEIAAAASRAFSSYDSLSCGDSSQEDTTVVDAAILPYLTD